MQNSKVQLKTQKFSTADLKKLYLPPKESHKGQNGKLAIVGGSHLFHGASLWALKVASRIVDMVFYCSIPENNELTKELKGQLYDFIAVPREKIEEYVKESDAILIGPGLAREEGRKENEESTKALTERLLKKFTSKKWVIDAGSLTEMDKECLKNLFGNVVITPHRGEFKTLFGIDANEETIASMSKEYNCIILLKGPTDVVCPPAHSGLSPSGSKTGGCLKVEGGNAGMTKGGTGDVLAGLVAALSCKNDLFLAASCGSFINKKAGDQLYQRVGPYFNASDLADEIPKVMKDLLT